MKARVITPLLVAAFAATTVQAEELWDTNLPGIQVGNIAGGLPPPGTYGVWDQYWAGTKVYNNAGNTIGEGIDFLVETPIVLWVSRQKVLGATFGMAAAFPFTYTNLSVPNSSATSSNAHWGMFNTILTPAVLSWSVAPGVLVKAGVNVSVRNASSYPGSPPPNNGLPAGNGYWSIQPTFSISWLHGGWNLSANGQYSYNFTNPTTDYRSGGALAIDYTLAKTVGAFTYGLGAYSINQLSADSGSGAVAAGCAARGGCKVTNYGIGPMLGYDFGSLRMNLSYTPSVYVRNDVGGSIVNLSLSTRF